MKNFKLKMFAKTIAIFCLMLNPFQYAQDSAFVTSQTIYKEWLSKAAVAGKSNVRCSADITYPIVSGFSDSNFEKFVNDSIFNLSKSLINIEDRGVITKNDTFVVKFNRAGILSILFISYESLGGAHGFSRYRGVNIDLYNNKLILFNNIIRKDGYPILNSIANRMLLEKTGQTMREIGGNLKRIGYLVDSLNLQKQNPVFVFSNTGIFLTFAEYEIGPYVFGSPEVNLPYELCASFINTDFPLARKEINTTFGEIMHTNRKKIEQIVATEADLRPKDEFETTQQYGTRLNNAKVKKKELLSEYEKYNLFMIEKGFEILKVKSESSKLILNAKLESVSKYNADDQTYEISVVHPELKQTNYRIKVPISSAKEFKINLKSVKAFVAKKLALDMFTKIYEFVEVEDTVAKAKYKVVK